MVGVQPLAHSQIVKVTMPAGNMTAPEIWLL